MKKSQKFYQMTVTKEQLQVISNACNVLARLQLGQWDIMFDELPVQKELDYEKYHQIKDTLRQMMPMILAGGMDGLHSSYGVANPNLPRENGVAFDLRDVIRHKLSWEDAVEKGIIESEDAPRKWPEMMYVNYDPPMKWGDEKLATITRIE
jgi:hypothetical protein